jgi:hypothetical protein
MHSLDGIYKIQGIVETDVREPGQLLFAGEGSKNACRGGTKAYRLIDKNTAKSKAHDSPHNIKFA